MIKGIKIQVGETTYEFTQEEAKELYEDLQEFFQTPINIPYIPTAPNPNEDFPVPPWKIT